MSWKEPIIWSGVPTPDQFNEQIRDNSLYLKGQADRLTNIVAEAPTRAFNTEYQASKLIMVHVSADPEAGAILSLMIYINSSSPASTVRAKNYGYGAKVDVTFLVPPGYYYKVTESHNGSSPTDIVWTEWSLY